MRNKSVTVCLIVIVFSLGLSKAEGAVNFFDGQTHNINWSIDDQVVVQSNDTTVNLLPDGRIGG